MDRNWQTSETLIWIQKLIVEIAAFKILYGLIAENIAVAKLTHGNFLHTTFLNSVEQNQKNHNSWSVITLDLHIVISSIKNFKIIYSNKVF